MSKIFLFVLCPPFHGSTILGNLLSSSPNVSSYLKSKKRKQVNGETELLWGDNEYTKNWQRWNEFYPLNMKQVENTFKRVLNDKKSIWLDKNPSTICRAQMFQDHFSKIGKVYFIASIRNPYSVRGWRGWYWLEYANWQRRNIETLNNVFRTSYEELCENTNSVSDKLLTWLPELQTLQNTGNKNIPNERGGEIHSDKISRILEPEKKNRFLKKHLDLMNYFGYEIHEPSRSKIDT